MSVRIDTVRKRIRSTIDLLEQVAVELDDLHTLAYDRATAVDEAHVAGGSRDYALDTHGDRRAREALHKLAQRTIDACGLLVFGTQDAVKLLQGDDTRRVNGPRTVTAIELAEAIESQGRRIMRDEYVPIRKLPQPDSTTAWSKLVAAKEHAERENARLARTIRDLEAELDGQIAG